MHRVAWGSDQTAEDRGPRELCCSQLSGAKRSA